MRASPEIGSIVRPGGGLPGHSVGPAFLKARLA